MLPKFMCISFLLLLPKKHLASDYTKYKLMLNSTTSIKFPTFSSNIEETAGAFNETPAVSSMFQL